MGRLRRAAIERDPLLGKRIREITDEILADKMLSQYPPTRYARRARP